MQTARQIMQVIDPHPRRADRALDAGSRARNNIRILHFETQQKRKLSFPREVQKCQYLQVLPGSSENQKVAQSGIAREKQFFGAPFSGA